MSRRERLRAGPDRGSPGRDRTERNDTARRRYPMPPAVDVLEAIHTARMLRILKPDRVPDALIERILEAATCAPSAGNAQAWSFVAVTDETQRRRLGDAYRRASVSVRDFYAAQGRPAHMSEDQFLRIMRSGLHL